MMRSLKIDYPNNIKKTEGIKLKTFGNRGMSLENDLNDTNLYYLEENIAIIYKKPTPIQVIETDYKKITKAFFKQPSTTDYNGLYKEKYIDFEAKETTSMTLFPLNNIHPHQITHIKNICNHGGICFLIVRFCKLNKTFLLFGDDFIDYINKYDKKSIPIKFFEDKGYLIKEKIKPRVDYIEILNKYGGFYETQIKN